MEFDEFGEIGYAVIDVEALLLGKVNVVEQIACVIISAASGKEVFSEKHIVYQPYGERGLVSKYGETVERVRRAIDGYKLVTCDNHVHDDPVKNPPWNAVRNRLRKILRRRAIKVYAKGADLERSVFGHTMNIQDLEWYGCPKYPKRIHDPLDECRFFSQYIPEIRCVAEWCNV